MFVPTNPIQRNGDAPEVFHDVFAQYRSFFRNAALCAAHDLSLFTAISGPLSCQELCVKLQLTSQHRLRALLHALTLEGFLCCETMDRFSLARQIPEQADKVPRYGWGRLAEVIRVDQPVDAFESEDDRKNSTISYHDYLYNIGSPVAEQLWKLTKIKPGHLLDIGAGSGVYTEIFLKKHPKARATLVDRENVLDQARHRLKNYASRVTYTPFDAFTPIPGKYDLVLLANLLHLYGPSECAKLIAAAIGPLRPGGILVIKDLWINQDRSGPADALYFALNMALYTEAGNVYSMPEVSTWLTDAGLTSIRGFDAPRSLIVTGTKG